ncbi:hypothetical protein [Streptomyces sp. NPDC005385]|uniref:hypothetical protein n=1 Tax=Streptomyces sp. NPDC005385 TaxID=3157039 RepID=UPI0033BB724C
MAGIGFDIPVACSADGPLRVICHQCQTLITDLRMDLTPVGEARRERLLANPEEFAAKQDRLRKRKLKESLIQQRIDRAARIAAEKVSVPPTDPVTPTKES